MKPGWTALRRGESVRERRRDLERAHERFVSDIDLVRDPQRRANFARDAGVRDVVLESWLRSHSSTIDPDLAPNQFAIDAAELEHLRHTHPLARVLPIVQRLLFDEAAENGMVVAVGDASGRLLWVEGDHRLRARAESMGFAAGTDWSEAVVGTSAPGSAIALGHPLQVLGAEHFVRAVHDWSCTAVPVHDPTSGALIGVVDVTGGDHAASPHLLPLLKATLAAVEAELKLETLKTMLLQGRSTTRTVVPPRSFTPRLITLGREPALLESAAGTTAVAGRHAEILLALALAPGGLSAAALAEEVYGDQRSEQTVRSEIVRLRRWLGVEAAGIDVVSRPYRLSCPLRIDAQEMLSGLGRGSHRIALAAYDGPVLPASNAPVAERLRADSEATLRESMLQSAAPEALFEYAHTWADDDVEVWEALLQLLPPLSPKRARVVARLAALHRAEPSKSVQR